MRVSLLYAPVFYNLKMDLYFNQIKYLYNSETLIMALSVQIVSSI